MLWKEFKERIRGLEEIGEKEKEAEERKLDCGWGDVGIGIND